MATYRHTLIAREGWLLISIAAIAATLVFVLISSALALIFVLFVVFFLFLFRDPPRKIPAAPLGIVSPIDGTVIAIDEVYDDFLDRQAMRFILKMNWYGIYSTRSPMEGKVLKQWSSESSAEEATSASMQGKSARWIQSDEGDDIIVCMPNDRITRRPGCLIHSGERIGQGQRCGFIHFGAVIELLIPMHSRIDIKKDTKVRAGSDILATLVHK